MSQESEQPTFAVAVRTDVGVSRSENQDFGFAGVLPGVPGWTLLAVADGLGGHARGDWASERAISLMIEKLAASVDQLGPADAFASAVAHANKVIFNESRDLGWPGSATTLVAVLVRGNTAWWLNIGDSRLYRFGGRLEQVSDDHSVVAEQVRAGLLSSEAAETHPHRNVVTRTVGFEPWVEPDIGGPLEMGPGDALLLCSDGLHGVVSEEAIAGALASLPPEEAADQLIRLANEAGGPDNITVAIGVQG